MMLPKKLNQASTCHLHTVDLECNEEENSENWEVLSDSESAKDVPSTDGMSLEIDALHRCISSPNLSTRNIHYRETDEFSDIDSYLDVRSLQTEGTHSAHVSSPKGSGDDWSMISTNLNLKKTPSFKDMLLMNMDSKQELVRKGCVQDQVQQTVVARKTVTPTFVVSNDKLKSSRLKRCGFSTGDLQVSVYPMGKRELPTQGTIIPEEEAVGDSDAMEFYNQKAMGSSSRAKGLKLRPDEAKRKEYSLSKKDVVRNSQYA